MAASILCVEDDANIGRLLTTLLSDAGYAAQWVADGETALERWHGASLILLDLMLPGIDGLSVCREIRARDPAFPLIMLTAKAGTRDVVRGLEIGADDYITKPFDSPILLARIAALLRRRDRQQSSPAGSQAAQFRVGDFILDIDAHTASARGTRMSLTTKEFALLHFFALHPGRAFTRGELLDAVWGVEFDGFDHTVNTHINRLRAKLQGDAATPRYIRTVWGVGYRFVADGNEAES
ncbi:MAG TPA: response regulator transcription factor [Nevskiaceae bacterium]|nr:response regulator transcription factor [Nevskiaceae bacterium]